MNETNEHQPAHHVPRARHAFDVKMEDGAMIRVRRHGIPGAPRLVLSHGNGLAIDGYFPFWGPLRDRYDVIVFDFRNHGQNPLHTAEGHHWRTSSPTSTHLARDPRAWAPSRCAGRVSFAVGRSLL